MALKNTASLARQRADAVRHARQREQSGRSRIWTLEETNVLLRHGYDIAAVQTELKNRSYRAIKHQMIKCGRRAGKKIVRWAPRDERLLREMYSSASKTELQAAFPQHTMAAIVSKARHIGVAGTRWVRPTPTPSGNAIVDAIRQRAWEDRVSARTLDAEIKSGKYFTRQIWKKRLNWRIIHDAVSFFGGKLAVDWQD